MQFVRSTVPYAHIIKRKRTFFFRKVKLAYDDASEAREMEIQRNVRRHSFCCGMIVSSMERMSRGTPI